MLQKLKLLWESNIRVFLFVGIRQGGGLGLSYLRGDRWRPGNNSRPNSPERVRLASAVWRPHGRLAVPPACLRPVGQGQQHLR